MVLWPSLLPDPGTGAGLHNSDSKEECLMSVITISKEAGTESEKVASLLAKKLD